jgi:RNA polymerase sigma-70 factor (ECF subfamily)
MNMKEKDKINELEENFEVRTGLNFKEFYKNYKPKLMWYITKYTKDPEVAEDHVEDAFIQALLNIKTYKRPEEGGAQVNTWIYKIAENIVKKAHKDSERLPTNSLDKEIAENFKLTNLIPYNDGKDVVEEYNIFVKKANIIKETIYNLPEKDLKYKRVLIMRELEGMAYKEISEELNINLSTIKSQIKKGRNIIKKKVMKKMQEIDNNGIQTI